jgi:hypothetical protein
MVRGVKLTGFFHNASQSEIAVMHEINGVVGPDTLKDSTDRKGVRSACARPRPPLITFHDADPS